MYDGGRLCGVASKWSTPLGRMRVYDEWKIYHTEQVARSQAGRGGRNLAPTHGEVRLAGDEAIRQGCIWDGEAGGRVGSGHLRGGT